MRETQLLPIGKSRGGGISKVGVSVSLDVGGAAAAAAAAPSPVAAGSAATPPPQGTSDRARIALLKSDINLVQNEIDAYRGDPSGILEFQAVLDKYQWSVDPASSAAVRDQLSSILLKKLNELAAVCELKLNRQSATASSSLLLPRNSLVGELVGFFQQRRLNSNPGGGVASSLMASNSGGGSPCVTPSPTSAAINAAAAPPVAASGPSALTASASSGVPNAHSLTMAAEDPVDDVVVGTVRLRKERGATDSPRVDVATNKVAVSGPTADEPRTPIDSLSDVDMDEEEEDVSWAPQVHKPPRRSTRTSLAQQTPEKTKANTPPAQLSSSSEVAKLQRQIDQFKLQLKFFKTLDKHLLMVQAATEQLQLISASAAVDGLHVSLPKAIEQFYPQGVPAVMAAITSVATTAKSAASPSASPGKKPPRKEDSSATVDLSSVSAPSALAATLAGPVDEKKLRIALAYQNGVLEALLNTISQKSKDDDATIAKLREQVDSLQKKLHTLAERNRWDQISTSQQLDRLSNAMRLNTPSGSRGLPSASAWMQQTSNVGGLASRPLSRASVADGGGLLGFHRPHSVRPESRELMVLPPRPSSTFAVVEVSDCADAVFGATRPATRTKPLVATRAEDLDGEKERRYLQVIRTQSDIIKDLSAKANGKSAASSVSNFGALPGSASAI